MIASVRGTVTAVSLDHVVIEVGGVGLAVRATPSTLARLHRGEQARIGHHARRARGFADPVRLPSDAAKELFELVQSVSGVGPKIALALIAVLEPDELRRALASADYATLTRAPGIGRKGAERLVLELRDKVGIAPALPSTGRSGGSARLASAALRSAGGARVHGQAGGRRDGHTCVGWRGSGGPRW